MNLYNHTTEQAFVRRGNYLKNIRRILTFRAQGCIFFYISPPPWGGGKESKGLRAREENQRRVEKMERQREKKRKISVGNS
jgi:hypothetical protein